MNNRWQRILIQKKDLLKFFIV
uniref:Uncharacterized protein n=1 Tax=Arundo donax TaxID=35708 RepID=A0A0A9AR08_ARUDO